MIGLPYEGVTRTSAHLVIVNSTYLMHDRVILVAPASPVLRLRLHVVKKYGLESTPDNWFSSCEINLQHRDPDKYENYSSIFKTGFEVPAQPHS